jgi:two-component system C4-dicarboxylate transport response regulator DctD
MFDGMKVLLVEDDTPVRIGAEQALQLAGFNVQSFASAERVRGRLAPHFPGVVVTDLKLPGLDGLELLREVAAMDPKLPVILITGHGDISTAVHAMREGAYDFITKPFASEQLVEVVRRALEKRSLILEIDALHRKLESREGIEARILGRSAAINDVRRLVLDLAETPANVLIFGETGTGKELVARCLHEFGRSRRGNFVALNCGGLPEALFESELFGHEPGAFTGALKRRIGKIEYAQDGTLFFDEIESMPLPMQVKLLRVLQERSVERLGSNEPIHVNCRVVAATKDDLAELSRQKKFREDLFYRLNVVSVEIPPLRDRREDIPLLFEHFVLEAALRYEREAPIVSTAQMHELMAYSWPGNVRELNNVASRFVLGLSGGALDLRRPDTPAPSLAAQVDRFERCLIEEALRRNHGRVAAAGEALGIPKKTLYDKMHRYGLASEDFQ